MIATYGLKLMSGTPSAKAIALAHKQTGLALSEIKQRAQKDDYIIACDCSDDEGLSTIIALYKELEKLGEKPTLFWHDKPEVLSFFENTLAAHKDTAHQLGLDE